MYIKSLVLLFVGLLLATLAPPAVSAKPNPMAVAGHRINVAPWGDAFFFEKDADFQSMLHRNSAWGRLHYNLWGQNFRFVFTGHNLTALTRYTLIYIYAESETGSQKIELGSGKSNRGGQLRIAANLDYCSLPFLDDYYFDYGARLWLVPSDDVEGFMDLSNEIDYLEIYHPIRFTNTYGCADLPEEEGSTDPSDEESEDSTDGSGNPGDGIIVVPY